jgi:hypothetical protein
MTNITPDDLRIAAEWLEAYENAPEDETSKTMFAVAVMLRATADRIEKASIVRKYASKLNVPTKALRAAIKRAKERKRR